MVVLPSDIFPGREKAVKEGMEVLEQEERKRHFQNPHTRWEAHLVTHGRPESLFSKKHQCLVGIGILRGLGGHQMARLGGAS